MRAASVAAGTPVVDGESVTAALRRAWDDPTAELLELAVELVPGTSPVRGGIYRLRGRAQGRNGERPWRMVLKVLRPLEAEMLARAREHTPELLDRLVEEMRWDREALAYRAGLLDNLPLGVAAARCYRVEERRHDERWLWLEHVGSSEPPRTIAELGRAAYHLGRFNGAYLVGRPLPTETWLSRYSLWPLVRFLATEGWAVVSDPALWRSRLARAAFPSPPTARLGRLWAEHGALHGALRRLPRTFCHHDAHQDNLYFRADGLVAIDWHTSGLGAIGEEIGPLVSYALNSYTVVSDKADELDRAVFAGYVGGLRAAGWYGDERLARLGYLASFVPAHALRMPQLNLLADAARHAAAERQRGMPIGEIARHQAALTHHLLDLGDEARRLMGELGL